VTAPILSPRQLDVLRLTEAGLTLREIGEELGFTFRSAKFHAHRAAERLGVEGRPAAIAEARLLGLLPGGDA